MKLQAPNGKTGELHLCGRTFVIDKSGQVDIPDDCLNSKLWQGGYTVVPAEPIKQKSEVSALAGKDKTNVTG